MSSPTQTSVRPLSGPRLLLVVAQAERRDELHALVSRTIPGARVEALDNVLDAILTAARRPPDLLLLDHAIDGAAAPALITNLARVSPKTKVLVFDDLADEPNEQPRSHAVRPWEAAESALLAWQSDHCAEPVAPKD